MDEIKQEQANKIVQELMRGKNTMLDMKIFGKDVLVDLILHLHSQKEKNAMANTMLIALSEYVAMVSMLSSNLSEATKTLHQHGIPFRSMMEVPAEEDGDE